MSSQACLAGSVAVAAGSRLRSLLRSLYGETPTSASALTFADPKEDLPNPQPPRLPPPPV